MNTSTISPKDFSLFDDGVAIESDHVSVTFCTRYGVVGAIFLVFQQLPWLIKIAFIIVRMLEYEVEVLHPGRRPFPYLVRRIIWLLSVGFLINYSVTFYLQTLIGQPVLRPECEFLRSPFGAPAPDPTFFFLPVTYILFLIAYYKLNLRTDRKLVLFIAPVLNAVALVVNGLNTFFEVVLGAVIGLSQGFIWALIAMSFLRLEDE